MIGTAAALIGSALISGGAALFGANAQSKAADKATKAQTAANDQNIALQKDVFAQQKAALKPWQDAGLSALKSIQDKIANGSFDLSKYGYDDLIKDPGYQFRAEQGTNALEQAAAARGKFISGDQLKDVTSFNSNLASQEFGNAFGRTQAERDTNYNILNTEATRGQNAASALSGVAGQMGQNIGTSIINKGNAAATGATNQGNIWANLGTNVANIANQGIENSILYNRLAKMGIT